MDHLKEPEVCDVESRKDVAMLNFKAAGKNSWNICFLIDCNDGKVLAVDSRRGCWTVISVVGDELRSFTN